MKILILGATGMLGSTIFRFLESKANLTVFATARDVNCSTYFPESLTKQLVTLADIEDHDALIRIFSDIKPDIVINCIGLIKQLKEANEPLLTISINALFPHRLVKLATLNHSRVIHISTDCVFSGKKGNYIETDFADANDLYGRTKFLGEVAYPNSITLRTSIIGHELAGSKSLINWFLNEKSSIEGYTKAIFSGLPTIELAEIIYKIIIPRPDLSGLYHVAAKPISKYELLQLVAKIYNKKIEIIPSDKLVIDRSLNASRFNEITGYIPPQWPDLIQAMYEFK